ncbi:hypothetical protein L2E82_38059 [Cichorium intybus]|uniref:Uncharacterized protein n=1 Tax=Cichorium intybus TaxID=13427 RepID=A0ACB9AJU1_CICIN|nr:hypothetical protein L2E82_38059 [Cichorium intybus]
MIRFRFGNPRLEVTSRWRKTFSRSPKGIDRVTHFIEINYPRGNAHFGGDHVQSGTGVLVLSQDNTGGNRAFVVILGFLSDSIMSIGQGITDEAPMVHDDRTEEETAPVKNRSSTDHRSAEAADIEEVAVVIEAAPAALTSEGTSAADGS